MNKLKENQNAKLRSVQGIMAETNLGRDIVMQIASEARAIVRYGKRGIRIEAERFYAHLYKEMT